MIDSILNKTDGQCDADFKDHSITCIKSYNFTKDSILLIEKTVSEGVFWEESTFFEKLDWKAFKSYTFKRKIKIHM